MYGTLHRTNSDVKRCPRCCETKPTSEFPRSRTSFDGLYGYCKPCKASYMRESNARRTPSQNSRYNLVRRCKTHGISIADYEQMLDRQGGICAICGNSDPGNRTFSRLTFDHDHVTGKLRGLLCAPCNTMIGQAKESPETLLSGARYLVLNQH